MRRSALPTLCRSLLLSLCLSVSASALAADADLVKRGEYVFHAAGCNACHTDKKHHGALLAGGVRVTTPFGVFYTPNITPDPKYGIGRWSDADFERAVREGISPEGKNYYPVFPYPAYTHMTDADLAALKAYIFSRPPVAQPNKPHALRWYIRFRPLIGIWKWLYFHPGRFVPDPARSAVWNRGAYLATALTHCGQCHTPRNALGGPMTALRFAGTKDGPDGAVIPNITPDKETGIGGWSRSDLVTYLQTGQTPDGDFAGGLMAEVIDNSTSRLTKTDVDAIAEYVHSLPPIVHSVRGHKKKKHTNGHDEYGF